WHRCHGSPRPRSDSSSSAWTISRSSGRWRSVVAWLAVRWFRRWAMPTPEQYRRGMVLLTGRAVAEGTRLISQPANTLVADTTALIATYSDGSAALAADQYDELRELAAPPTRYRARVVVDLREEKIRRGVLWAADPLGWT